MAYETLNEKWHSYQSSHSYVDSLADAQRVVIETDLLNRYVYQSHCENGENLIGQWTWTKNGVQQMELDEDDIPTGEIDIIIFTVLDTILKNFFEDVDLITLQPLETPIKVFIR